MCKNIYAAHPKHIYLFIKLSASYAIFNIVLIIMKYITNKALVNIRPYSSAIIANTLSVCGSGIY